MSIQVRRAVIYARLSVSQEESVSIDRQVEACTKYASARGWEVVATCVDDGVSATHNKPEQRLGWRSVLSLDVGYDVVIVWKVDRLARRVLDFLHAHEALKARQAAVVAVEEPIDMSTPQGQAFATMLAVFAEMEAAAISARVKGARDYLVRSGRAVGGTVPYGYRTIKNPNGKGYVLTQDEKVIGFVLEATHRALRGETVYSIQQWLSQSAPLPTSSQTRRTREGWAYSTVERLLRNPILAGMIAYNPGNSKKTRGDEVLRDEKGLPVVHESLAILTTDERRRLLAALDNEDKAQRRPRASREATPPLLSGLAECGECNRTMHRGTTAGRPALACPSCYQTISMEQLTKHIETRLLSERGDELGIDAEVVTTDNDFRLADIEGAIADVSTKLTRDDADVQMLVDQLTALKGLRATARGAQPNNLHYNIHDYPVREEWEAATTDDERRTVLLGQMRSLRIVRGKVGRWLDPSRVIIEWRPAGEHAGAMQELFSWMQPGDTYSAVHA